MQSLDCSSAAKTSLPQHIKKAKVVPEPCGGNDLRLYSHQPNTSQSCTDTGPVSQCVMKYMLTSLLLQVTIYGA